MGLFQKIKQFFKPFYTPKKLAEQLRQPHGKMGEIVAKKMNESNAVLYDFTLDHIKFSDQQNILELGFGNGLFFEKVIHKAKKLRIFGIDFSELMVQTARRSNAEYIESGHLKLLYGDCKDLPFDSNKMDIIYCINVVYFWEDPSAYLTEILRVLKPGGAFYASIRMEESMKHFPFVEHGFTMYNANKWSKVLKQNGFKNIEVFPIIEKDVEFNQVKFDLESACIVGFKPSV